MSEGEQSKPTGPTGPDSSINSIEDAYGFIKNKLSGLPPTSLMRRDAAVRVAVKLGYPTTRSEDWRYTSLRDFKEKNFRVSIKPPKIDIPREDLESIGCQLINEAVKLVFVDGELSLGLSDTRLARDTISIKTLFEGELYEDNNWRSLDGMPGLNQTFAQVAVAMADHGIVLKIAPRSQAKTIHIMHINSAASSGVSRSSRVVIDVQRLGTARVIEEFMTLGNPSHHVNNLTQIIAAEGCDAGYYRIDRMADQSYLTSQVSCTIGHNAKVELFSLTAGSKWSRVNLDVNYTAEGGECLLDGLVLLKDSQHCDHHTRVEHVAPQCQTRQLYKTILAGSSRAVFNGKIIIPRGSSGSEAYQTNKNLLLSPDAEVNTKPELLIDNNDVKATHGAAIGAINPQELFYLQTRGIDRSEAEAILCRGFASEVTMRIEDPIIKRMISNRVQNWFDAPHSDTKVMPE